jgi:hypothetical protein
MREGEPSSEKGEMMRGIVKGPLMHTQAIAFKILSFWP